MVCYPFLTIKGIRKGAFRFILQTVNAFFSTERLFSHEKLSHIFDGMPEIVLKHCFLSLSLQILNNQF